MPVTVLSVRGSASLEVDPDHAQLAVAVSVVDDDRAAALARASALADALRRSLGGQPGVRTHRLSRVRVGPLREWDPREQREVDRGWQASMSGSADVDAGVVGAVVAAAVAAGASVGWVQWLLDDDNPGPREVRRLAVSAARRSADDFAEALGGTVGDLLELADPGLVSGAVAAAPAGAQPMTFAAHGQDAGWVAPDVDVDPQPVLVEASVEARYAFVPGSPSSPASPSSNASTSD